MFQRGISLLFCCLVPTLASVLPASSLAAPMEIPMDGYAAIVGDRVITIGEVMAFMRPIDVQLRDQFQGEELQGERARAFRLSRERLVEDALIIAEFNARGAAIPEHLVDERVNALVHENFDDDRAAFLEALAAQRMSYEEMREQIKEGLIVMIMRRQEVMDRVHVQPMAVLEAYEKNRARYEEPGRVKLRMIAIHKGRTNEEQAIKRAEIQALLEKLRAGRDFADLARESSEDARAKQGGEWDWINPAMLRPELAQSAQTLPVGVASEIIEAGEMMYIMLVEARQEAAIVPFEKVRAEIERELRIREEERLYNEWMNRLRDKFFVQILAE